MRLKKMSSIDVTDKVKGSALRNTLSKVYEDGWRYIWNSVMDNIWRNVLGSAKNNVTNNVIKYVRSRSFTQKQLSDAYSMVSNL